MKKIIFPFGFALLFLTVQASAESGARKSFYVTTAAVLESDFEFAGDLNNEEEESSGYYLGIGYDALEWLSVEAGYTDANDYWNNNGLSSEVRMFEISALARMNVGENLSPYLRLGVYDASTQMGGPAAADSSETGVLWGLGVDYALTQRSGLRADFTPGDLDDDGLDRLMIGVFLRFGD